MNRHLNNFVAFIKERHSVYIKKKAGLSKPWTDDIILRSYRFCNVYRELDTETKWIRENWRDPHKNDENVWFAMAVARYVNWHPSLAAIGYPVPWKKEKFKDALSEISRRGDKVFTGAYMIKSDAAVDKISYVAAVLDELWSERHRIRTGSLEDLYTALCRVRGVGSFMAGQIVADAKYTKRFELAEDWWTFAAVGPGSARGLNRVLNRYVDTRWRAGEWEYELYSVQNEADKCINKFKMPRLHAQDLQNCLCEFDKYERVRLGEGRPRSRYNGGG